MDYKCETPKIILLLPNQIKTDPQYKVRFFDYDPTSTEMQDPARERMEQLIESIERRGQLEPVLLTPEHVLYAGQRRVQAIAAINTIRSANSQSVLKVHCIVDHDCGDYLAKAIATNLQRQNLSPMDLAYLLIKFREQKHYSLSQLCDYFNLSKSYVLHHLNFLKAPKELQNWLHIGRLTTDGLITILKASDKPTVQIELAHRSLDKELEAQTARVMDDFEAGKKSQRQTTNAIQEVPAKLHRIHKSSIVQAIRDSKQPRRRRLRLSRPEIVEAIASLDCEMFAAPQREFVRYVLDCLFTGKGNQDELFAKFAAIAPCAVRLAG